MIWDKITDGIYRILNSIRRKVKYDCQRVARGFDDSDLWNLDDTIANFVLPRLIAFKEMHGSHPGDLKEEEWDAILDDMIYAMDAACNKFTDATFDEARTQKGLELFGKYFQHLWD